MKKRILILSFIGLFFLNEQADLKSSSYTEEEKENKQAENFKKELERLKNHTDEKKILETEKYNRNEKYIEYLKQNNKDLQRIMKPHDIIEFLWKTRSLKLDKERSSFKIGQEWGIRIFFIPSPSYKKGLNKAFFEKKAFYEEELKKYFKSQFKKEKMRIHFEDDKKFFIFLIKGNLTAMDYKRSEWHIHLGENKELKSVEFKADARSLRNQIEKIESDYLDRKINLSLGEFEEENYLEMELSYLSGLIDLEFKTVLMNKYYIMQLLFYRAFNPDFYIWKGDSLLDSEFYKQFHLLIQKDSNGLDRFLIRQDLNQKNNFMKIKEWAKPFRDFTWFKRFSLIKENGKYLIMKIPELQKSGLWQVKPDMIKHNQYKSLIAEDNHFIPLYVQVEKGSDLSFEEQKEQIMHLQNLIEAKSNEADYYHRLDDNEKILYKGFFRTINFFSKMNYKLEKLEEPFIEQLLRDSNRKRKDIFLIFRNLNSNNPGGSLSKKTLNFNIFYICIKDIYELFREKKHFRFLSNDHPIDGMKNYRWYTDASTSSESLFNYNPKTDHFAVYNIHKETVISDICRNLEFSLYDFKLFEDFLEDKVEEAPIFKDIQFQSAIKEKSNRAKVSWVESSDHDLDDGLKKTMIHFIK